MSDQALESRWDQFWFKPTTIDRVAAIRGVLCLVTACYFAACWSDAAFWYGEGGPLSLTRVATFLEAADVQESARWILSPLFLIESLVFYRVYLVIGISLALLVAIGRGGQLACWMLWIVLVGCANRAMILSGLTESLLSLGLFATAIAPAGSSLNRPGLQKDSSSGDWRPSSGDWRSGFSQRLVALQITLVGIATFVTMLGGRVWFNGIGAYALAAPVEDRTIDWTESLLVNPLVHESLTHLMVIALPLGLSLAWIEKTNRLGQAILCAWCLLVALLGSHWLYAITFAAMVWAIRPRLASVGNPRTD